VNAGYVNSGAVLPDQEVSGGVVRLEIVEGQLETVEITGTRSLDARFLERRVRLGAGRPLDIVALQERLQLLLLDPSIERLDARLLPGSAPGQARLEVAVEERPASSRSTSAPPTTSRPASAAPAASWPVTWRNLLGRGDPLRLTLRGSEGLREVGFGYAFPSPPATSASGSRARPARPTSSTTRSRTSTSRAARAA
jgi:hemolysin activation/secretion protein